MRVIIGILIILFGIFLGVYVGLWLMFIGGIISIIDAFRSNPINSGLIAIGLLKVILANVVGWLSFLVCFVLGGALISD